MATKLPKFKVEREDGTRTPKAKQTSQKLRQERAMKYAV